MGIRKAEFAQLDGAKVLVVTYDWSEDGIRSRGTAKGEEARNGQSMVHASSGGNVQSMLQSKTGRAITITGSAFSYIAER